MNDEPTRSIIKLFYRLQEIYEDGISSDKRFIHKRILKRIIKIKKSEREKISKHLKKLNKYKNGQYIDFPNGISFELGKGPETINGTNIKIGENEFYIKTHIEKNGEYIKYVESLKKARELFEKRGIKIKYCKRCTWLANREFIKAYETKRKEKKGAKYKKSNILKVLEQTESAVVSYKLEEYGEPAIRFMDEDSDLYKFATGEGEELFHKTEMRLDLDLL